MIGRIRGLLLEKQPPELLVEAHGVGYEVTVPLSTFYRLPEAGQELMLFTHLAVREDAHQLFGFASITERKLFRSLIKVNGVGPKMALAVLSSIEPDAFVQSILENDSAALIRLPGIGKKTAERLIIEMRDRLSDWYDNASFTANTVTATSANIASGSIQEAINALIALGYKPPEASRAVNKTGLKADANCEDIIRAALKLLAGG
jgi:Holliday junction DNA helicase RuvA